MKGLSRSVLMYCVLSVCAISSAIGADYPMLHYSTAGRDLPSNNVYCVYRDRKGFLWFGTDKGIARYNGIKFETFTTTDGLPDNEVFLFREDYQGRIWMTTYNGELCFWKDGIFHTAANTPYLRMPFKCPHIHNITIEKDSSVSFNFFDWRVLVNIKNDVLKTFVFDKGKCGCSVTYSYYTRMVSPGKIQLVSETEVLILDTSGHLLSSFDKQWQGATMYVPIQDTGFYLIRHSYDPSKFTAGNDHVISTNFDSVYYFAGPLYKDKAARAYYTDDARRFFCTDRGIIVDDSILVLKDCDVSSMTQDAVGNYWVSTLNKGVFCLPVNFGQTARIKNVYDYSVNYTRAAGGGIYFAHDDNSLSCLKSGSVSVVYKVAIAPKASIDRRRDTYREQAFLVDPQAEWFIDVQQHKYTIGRLPVKPRDVAEYVHDTVLSDGIKELFKLGDQLFLTTRKGAVCYSFQDLTKGTATRNYVLMSDRDRVYSAACSPKYGFWTSTSAGTYVARGDKVILSLGFDSITFKAFAFAGDALVGHTLKNQLLIADLTHSPVTIDTVPAQNCVWDKLYVIDTNHVLISTNNRNRILTLRNRRLREVFAIECAFIPDQAHAVCVDSFASHFFSDGGIVSIPNSTLIQRSQPPVVFFTSVASGTKVYRELADMHNNVELPYIGNGNVVISFGRVVASGQSILQQYAIARNGSESWTDVVGESINFTNPGYGDFVIKIRARTLSSAYCVPVVLTIHIGRPFWATWWFLLIVAGCLIAFMVAAVRYRTRQLVRKNEQEHQNEMKFVKSEYKALNALMNPHFIFNTLNNVQGLVNRDDKLAANEYIRVFADLIRQNMHNLSKEMITLQKEMELVVNYLLLEKLRFKELLNYAIEVDDKLDLSEIFVPPLLIQPLVENSIKHGILPLESVEGAVVIRIYEQGTSIFIEVRDNGVGLSKSLQTKGDDAHESFAMENIKKRIVQLSIILDKQITLDIREEMPRGEQRQWTVVTISVPAF